MSPIYLDLKPNSRTLVWVWAWLQTAKANGVFVALTANMPVVCSCALHPPLKPVG